MSQMKNRDSNKSRRADRQVQAAIRQEAYDKLSLAEKVAKLTGFTASKQRAKLASAIAKQNEPQALAQAAKTEGAIARKAAKPARNDKKAQKAAARKASVAERLAPHLATTFSAKAVA